MDEGSPIPRRRSAFIETGLIDVDSSTPQPAAKAVSPRSIRFNSKPDIFEYTSDDAEDDESEQSTNLQIGVDGQSSLDNGSSSLKSTLHMTSATMYRIAITAIVLAVLFPLLHGTTWLDQTSVPAVGVEGGPIKRNPGPVLDADSVMSKRQSNSPTDVCFRWAHASAIVNGTLYIYGGEASTGKEQPHDTWNNNFLTLDLTKSWQITSPPLVGLPQPSGPPSVALAYLWNSYDSLYLYGGEYSSDPPATPDPLSLWEYNIPDSNWIQHQNPQLSDGRYASGAGTAVGRAAEGAGVSVPSLGRGWFFGGHQDGYTTPGWSQSIPRIYLTSLLEYTFPGFTNDQVQDLSNGKTAGSDGVYRNITQAGVQNTNGFPERADSIIVYVPGYGTQGILVGLAGGTNDTFQQMSQLDVYDIANSVWFKQATSGPTPKFRVNPCAVVAAAPDGSTQNIYMFGGQSLQPEGSQTQYDDMWILTLPSFTWIQVDQSQQSVPYARAGHTCNVWNGQMVVVGGYVDPQISCDSPGVYVFDMSNLKWTTDYRDLSANSGDAGSAQNNPLNQQPVQRAIQGTIGGLEGSYGYTVPAAVQSVVGGGPTGGATVTAPAQMPTDGPLKTGRPVTYTVTATAGGSVVTETAGGQPTANSGKSSNVGAIVAGVVAGILAIIVGYLLFCLWLYRKRLALYKRHSEMAQRASFASGEEMPFVTAYYGSGGESRDSAERANGKGEDYMAGNGRAGSYAGSGGNGSSSGSGSGGYAGRPVEMKRADKSVDDLLAGGEPSFWGTMLSPKRSLRVTNSD